MNRFIAFLLLHCTFLVATSQSIYIHCGLLIDGIADEPREEMTVVVEDDKIISVEKGYVEPGDNDELIDLSGQTVMPGLMDLHVHIESETSPDHYLKEFTQSPEVQAFESIDYANRTLMAGFTTVRDLGGSGVNIALRDAIDKGQVVGPRIFTSGKSIATTGGHADPTNGYRRDLEGNAGPKQGVADGKAQAIEAVRWRYKNGADVIKITATGGVLSVAKSGQNPQFRMEELEAIVSTARDYGYHVAVHAHGPEGMKRAVKAGVHSIEHGTLMPEEVMDLMLEHETWYVPTLSAGKFVLQKIEEKPGYYPPVVQKKAKEIGPRMMSTFTTAYNKGLKIAFGTDAGVFPHGENWKEFKYMMEGGMTAMETIQAATIHAAELMNMQDRLGSIEEGKLADIIAMDGNPMENIEVMGKVVFVMKAGKVFKN